MDDYQKEMETNYPAFKKHIYAQLRAEFERTLPPIPEGDFLEFIKKKGGIPLEEFIHEIEGSNS